MIVLKNNTGGASKKGYLAKLSSKDGYFEYAGVGDPPIGVISKAVPQNGECEIITDGEAVVYMHKKVQPQSSIRQQLQNDGARKGALMPYDRENDAVVIGKSIERGRGLIRAYVSFSSVNYEDLNFGIADTQWEDLRAPATAINPPGQASDPDFDNTNGGWLFDAGGTEVLWVILQLPHGWKEGTSIRPHIHWMPTNTNTGNVLWRIEYKWTSVGETEPGSFTTVDVLDAGDGTALKHQIASFEEIDGTGKTLSSIFSVKLSRIGGDGTDTYNADALLKEFDVHYEVDSFGSDEEFTKRVTKS